MTVQEVLSQPQGKSSCSSTNWFTALLAAVYAQTATILSNQTNDEDMTVLLTKMQTGLANSNIKISIKVSQAISWATTPISVGTHSFTQAQLESLINTAAKQTTYTGRTTLAQALLSTWQHKLDATMQVASQATNTENTQATSTDAANQNQFALVADSLVSFLQSIANITM